MTNGDRIRKMTDKELTDFLNNIHEPDFDDIMIDNHHFYNEDEIYDWLQTECELGDENE